LTSAQLRDETAGIHFEEWSMERHRLPVAAIAACTTSWLLAVQDLLFELHSLLFLNTPLDEPTWFPLVQGLFFLIVPALLVWKPREDIAATLACVAAMRLVGVGYRPLAQGDALGAVDWALRVASGSTLELGLVALAFWSWIALRRGQGGDAALQSWASPSGSPPRPGR
jgi:hypothetical protein